MPGCVKGYSRKIGLVCSAISYSWKKGTTATPTDCGEILVVPAEICYNTCIVSIRMEAAERMTEKRKTFWKKFLGSAGILTAFLLIGFFCGTIMGNFLSSLDNLSTGELFCILFLFLGGLYLSVFLQIAAHEWGHYLFGRITGYRFASFRLGSFILLRVDGKLRLKRFSLAGTGGQCLMDPPPMTDGKFPYVLYNLGGSIVNFVLGLAACLAAFLPGCPVVVSCLLFVFAVIGIAFALLNGIPMQAGMINNDGYNALALGKSGEALRSFWIQMKGNVLTGCGVRIRDMPEEWFVMPEEDGLQNTMTAVLAVLACNRKMDEGRLEEADLLMEKLLAGKNAVTELHRRLLVCDRIFCLLYHDRTAEATALYDREQQKFMKTMKQFPSVMRTEYALALLAEQDPAKAAKIQERFGKQEKIYPYPVEFQAEREFMALAAQKGADIPCAPAENKV